MSHDPVGSVVRNLFFLQRLGNGLSKESGRLILGLFDDVAGQLGRIDPTGVAADRHRQARFEKLMGFTTERTADVFKEWHRAVRQDLAVIGRDQSAWAKGLLSETLGGVGIDLRPGQMGLNAVKAIVDAKPFRAGPKAADTLAGWAKTQEAATIRRIERHVKLGMLQNEPLGDLIRRIRGRSVGGGRFVGGVLQTTTKDAEAIVRTGVNFVANQGHLSMYQENADVLEGIESVAVLDTRTTLICIALDGKVWALDDPDMDVPPRHFNCRSVLVPKVAWSRLGLDVPEPGTRATFEGQIPASQVAGDWLKNQPAPIQDELLGKRRADLFRAGKVDLRDLVTKDGKVIPVAELEKRAGVVRPKPAPPPPPPPPPAPVPPVPPPIPAARTGDSPSGPEIRKRLEAEAQQIGTEAEDLRATNKALAADYKAELKRDLTGLSDADLAARRAKMDAIGNDLSRFQARIRELEGDNLARYRAVVARDPKDRFSGPITTALRKGRKVVDEGIAAFRTLVSDRYHWVKGPKSDAVTVTRTGRGRAFFKGPRPRALNRLTPGSVYVSEWADVETVVHELGHALEVSGTGPSHSTDFLWRKATEFLNRRTQGESAKRLLDLTGETHFKPHEVAKPDKFFHAYVGRIYPTGETEVISMGIERLWASPLAFAREDPDYFDFIWRVITGAILDETP